MSILLLLTLALAAITDDTAHAPHDSSGNVVASQTCDLNQTRANAAELIVGVDIPDSTKVYTFKMTAILGIGEKITIDGVEVERN